MIESFSGSSNKTLRNLPNIKTLVIKIGSSILADSSKGVNEFRITQISEAIKNIKKEIPNVIIVSSGAVAAGFRIVGFEKRPSEIIDKQACAAVGQARLMWFYEQAFAKHNIHVAQMLVTKYDFSNRTRYLNARATLKRLLELGVVPILNENDPVVVNELKYIESFGDNDNLSSLVASMVGADMLIILSDVDGLYDSDPTKNVNAQLLSEVAKIDSSIISLASDSGTDVGTGGMFSKLSATKKALKAGCHVAIVNGKTPQNLERFLKGEKIGTYFTGTSHSNSSKRLWFAYATIPSGVIVIDDGARDALIEKKSSLLASGILSVTGDFREGDIVSIVSKNGNEVAVGKVKYSADALNMIKGKKTKEILQILGYKKSDEVVHRDDMGLA